MASHLAIFELRNREEYLVRTHSICLAALEALAGCSSGDFPVAPTRGQVICEGQPVPRARVFFEPLETGKSAIVGKQGLATADQDGRFVLSTFGENDGAVIGKHRVRVDRPFDPEEKPAFKCPCVLNAEVDVTEVEVKKGVTNEFQVVLKKRTGQEPKPLAD